MKSGPLIFKAWQFRVSKACLLAGLLLPYFPFAFSQPAVNSFD
jgi:hypothetical protein